MAIKRITKIFSIICILLLFTTKAYCDEQDSIIVYIENDSVNYKVNIIFENTTNDSIWLYGNFKEFRHDFPSSSGYIILYYYNHKLVIPQLMDYDYYNDYKLKTITILPNEKFKIRLNLPWFGTHEQAKINEYGIELQIVYKYIIANTRQFVTRNLRTNYLKLEYE